MMEDGGTYTPPKRTIFKRIRDRLFPWSSPKSRTEFMARAKHGGVAVVTYIALNWPDTLRVIFGGVLVVETITNTEREPGKTESMSFVNIAPLGALPIDDKFLRNRGLN